MRRYDRYHYVIVNDDARRASEVLAAIILVGLCLYATLSSPKLNVTDASIKLKEGENVELDSRPL